MIIDVMSCEQEWVIDADGAKIWRNAVGELHRIDGPAIEGSNGNGNRYWCLNGKLHREGGPAVEMAAGTKKWFLHGQLHRIDGPAIEYSNGTKFWYIKGKKLTEKEFNNRQAQVS